VWLCWVTVCWVCLCYIMLVFAELSLVRFDSLRLCWVSRERGGWLGHCLHFAVRHIYLK
jgi:hypothetical protein